MLFIRIFFLKYFSPPSLDISASVWTPCGYSRAANEKRTTTRSRHMSDVPSPSGVARTPRSSPAPESSCPDRHLTGARAPQLAPAPLPLTDPARHAKRLPVRVLQMLSARAAHMLHADYLQPLSSAPLPIEVPQEEAPTPAAAISAFIINTKILCSYSFCSEGKHWRFQNLKIIY